MALDLTSAKLKHASWKHKLRDFLDGKSALTAAQATDHRQCELGKWLYAEGLTKYAAIPEMKQLEHEHEALHGLIKTIINFQHAGKVDEAEAEFAKVEGVSKRIVGLLTAIEAKVDRKAA